MFFLIGVNDMDSLEKVYDSDLESLPSPELSTKLMSPVKLTQLGQLEWSSSFWKSKFFYLIHDFTFIENFTDLFMDIWEFIFISLKSWRRHVQSNEFQSLISRLDAFKFQ